MPKEFSMSLLASPMNNNFHGDIAWILTATALVLIMTPGIGFFYGGLAHRKNAYTILIQSILVMCLVGTIWPILAYSLAFGPDMLGGLVGNFDFVCLFLCF